MFHFTSFGRKLRYIGINDTCAELTGFKKSRYLFWGFVVAGVGVGLGAILTIVSLSVGTLMGGSVVVETIFRWPGIGKLVMDSITARDYPVIMGFVLVMGTIYVVINFVSDVLYHVLDPRV